MRKSALSACCHLGYFLKSVDGVGGKVVFALGVGVSHLKNNYACVVCALLLLSVGGL